MKTWNLGAGTLVLIDTQYNNAKKILFLLNREEKLCGVCTKRQHGWKKDILKQLNPPATPCMNNVKVEMWETNYWELAKVFMGPGQDTTTAPSVTDPKGLLQLVINCKLLSNCVSRMESFKNVSVWIVLVCWYYHFIVVMKNSALDCD